MPKILNTLELTVDAARARHVLADLTDAASWIPGVVSARMHGDVRVCTTVDGAEIRERISGFSPERMCYRYEHLATPAPVRDSRGTLRVCPTETGCRVGRAAAAGNWASLEDAHPLSGLRQVARAGEAIVLPADDDVVALGH
jgi:Polyketide cyclase / dehydrase and lipid transport